VNINSSGYIRGNGHTVVVHNMPLWHTQELRSLLGGNGCAALGAELVVLAFDALPALQAYLVCHLGMS
jgi:hypothetical protein